MCICHIKNKDYLLVCETIVLICLNRILITKYELHWPYCTRDKHVLWNYRSHRSVCIEYWLRDTRHLNSLSCATFYDHGLLTKLMFCWQPCLLFDLCMLLMMVLTCTYNFIFVHTKLQHTASAWLMKRRPAIENRNVSGSWSLYMRCHAWCARIIGAAMQTQPRQGRVPPLFKRPRLARHVKGR